MPGPSRHQAPVKMDHEGGGLRRSVRGEHLQSQRVESPVGGCRIARRQRGGVPGAQYPFEPCCAAPRGSQEPDPRRVPHRGVPAFAVLKEITPASNLKPPRDREELSPAIDIVVPGAQDLEVLDPDVAALPQGAIGCLHHKLQGVRPIRHLAGVEPAQLASPHSPCGGVEAGPLGRRGIHTRAMLQVIPQEGFTRRGASDGLHAGDLALQRTQHPFRGLEDSNRGGGGDPPTDGVIRREIDR